MSDFQTNKKTTKEQRQCMILGQDPAILSAVWSNVLSWLVRTLAPSLLPLLLPSCTQEEEDNDTVLSATSSSTTSARTKCVAIGRPGGIEQLRVIYLKPGILTVGYNVPGQDSPFTTPLLLEKKKNDDDAADDNDDDANVLLPPDCVVLKNEAFSVNYADCCIRWGLYESAKQYVGYPIVPGFDVAGMVERVGDSVVQQHHDLQPGDRVFGCSFFGAYSSRVLVPAVQLRKIPSHWTFAQAAALPTVSLTALYALHLAGHFPLSDVRLRLQSSNRAILIHSCCGGVGSMLVHMSKILGLQPIVGVVGKSSKVEAAVSLGCDVVIDKSVQNLWACAHEASPRGYSAIMDSNGVDTLESSYQHLAMTGRLIVFGFHTNLPVGQDALHPLHWLRMALKMRRMPHINIMEMGQANKSILAFNLSFFATEREMLAALFDQILDWIQSGQLQCPRIVEMEMDRIAEAHSLIQSGKSVGKIVLTTKASLYE